MFFIIIYIFIPFKLMAGVIFLQRIGVYRF